MDLRRGLSELLEHEVSDRAIQRLRDKIKAKDSEKQSCETPSTPQPAEPLLTLVPGDLVLASLYRGDGRLWPGIIEDSILRKPSPDEPFQTFYQVTFIRPKNDDRKWVGGFVRGSEIQPFIPPSDWKDEYAQSQARAREAAFDGPQQCLKKFSFVYHVAKKRGIDIDEPSSASSERTGQERTGDPRMDTERGRVPTKRKRSSTEDS